jgi:putative salt-induced outer membrane protein
VDARLIGPLSARFAYSVEHNSDPPLATLRTDTLSRFTLVYDF